eukprot:m.624460 g.624460  ORF g.624460 m.624460 type:complete len:50 (+) comp58231_c1_seq1:561-710(+)
MMFVINNNLYAALMSLDGCTVYKHDSVIKFASPQVATEACRNPSSIPLL